MITTLLSVFCCIAGAYIFYCSAMGAIGQTELLYQDAQTCPSDFRPMQAHGRRILVANSLVRLASGSAVLIAGACTLASQTVASEGTAHTIVLCTGLSLCVWTLVSMLIARGLNMECVIEGIGTQWKKEKRISARHDDEVRLYRVLKEAVGIPTDNLILLMLMITAFCIS